MGRCELQADLLDYFIAAFIWGLREHERFEQFWASIYGANMAQDTLLARFSSDGRVLGLAVHDAVFQDSTCVRDYNAYDTADRFVDLYIAHTLENAGALPTAHNVEVMAKKSVVV